MSRQHVSQRPDRPEPDIDDLEQVYERVGIDSTADLERLVEYYLRHRGFEEYDTSAACRTALVRSFEDAFLDESGQPILPEAVDSALEDASYWLQENPSGHRDIRTDIVPQLVAKVGLVVPAYADRGLDTVGRLSVS